MLFYGMSPVKELMAFISSTIHDGNRLLGKLADVRG
jgi:hypothetical protein